MKNSDKSRQFQAFCHHWTWAIIDKKMDLNISSRSMIYTDLKTFSQFIINLCWYSCHMSCTKSVNVIPDRLREGLWFHMTNIYYISPWTSINPIAWWTTPSLLPYFELHQWDSTDSPLYSCTYETLRRTCSISKWFWKPASIFVWNMPNGHTVDNGF